MLMYDIVIIGAGTAGMSAAIYGVRSGKKVLLLEEKNYGGQIVNTPEVENYPGIIKTSGFEFATNLFNQAKSLGAEIKYEKAVEIKNNGVLKEVITNKETYETKAIIIATGAKNRSLKLDKEKELIGSGVSYCATCDGSFFEDFDIYVVGGGDTAVEEAMYLTKFGRSVTIIHRRDELRAAKSIQDKAFKNPKIKFMWNTIVKELKGDGILNTMVVENVKTREQTTIVADEEDMTFGVFGFIGYIPKTDIFKDILTLERGYIVTDENMKTNIDGIFAAGDVRVKSLRQVVTAASDGAIAAVQAEKYIESLK